MVITKTKQTNCEIWAPGGPGQEDQPERERERERLEYYDAWF